MDSMGKSDAPATKADLEVLRGNLEGLRGDFEGLREDFEGVRNDLAATKVELNVKIDASTRRLAKEIVDLQMKFHEMNDRVATKDDIKKLVDAVESFAGKSQAQERATVLHGRALTEVAVQMKNHERRLRALESRPR